MNRTAITSAIISLLILVHAMALLSFPYPESSKRQTFTATDKDAPMAALIGYYNYAHRPTDGRTAVEVPQESKEEKAEKLMPGRVDSDAFPCKAVTYRYKKHDDKAGLRLVIVLPQGNGAAAKAVLRWIRHGLEETVYERDFTLDELVDGWRKLLVPSAIHERCFYPILIDKNHVTFRDTGKEFSTDTVATFNLATGRRLTKPILPTSDDNRP